MGTEDGHLIWQHSRPRTPGATNGTPDDACPAPAAWHSKTRYPNSSGTRPSRGDRPAPTPGGARPRRPGSAGAC
jgi:hypothetical protein